MTQSDAEILSLQYYPFEKVQGYGTMPELEQIPYLIRDYLMDMPKAGYTPVDDNRLWRCRLMKYLYHDVPRPLDEPLPTPEQKMSLVFDPENPTKAPTDKGYRIFSQSMVSQAQTVGQTMMRIYMGRAVPVDSYTTEASIIILFMSNAAYESNTKTVELNRTYNMACLAMRALNGVNMKGVGTIYFDRRRQGDCNIMPITDETTNVGYRLTMGVSMTGANQNDQ